ncbi:MAG: hypothetical protein ACREBW_08990, partial [Candidatus Micrarchaeaceae archaeon]
VHRGSSFVRLSAHSSPTGDEKIARLFLSDYMSWLSSSQASSQFGMPACFYLPEASSGVTYYELACLDHPCA